MVEKIHQCLPTMESVQTDDSPSISTNNVANYFPRYNIGRDK